VSVQDQPLWAVGWEKRGVLKANNYNPNLVAPPELELLKLSILESGWTQPIVALEDGEIVDGFHRWTVAEDPEVAALTGGLVPVVRLRGVTREHQIAATIRHNRARGVHAVLKMADIVSMLIDEHGVAPERVEAMLGMDFEEVDRLSDASGMPARAGAGEFGKGWTPDV